MALMKTPCWKTTRYAFIMLKNPPKKVLAHLSTIAVSLRESYQFVSFPQFNVVDRDDVRARLQYFQREVGSLSCDSVPKILRQRIFVLFHPGVQRIFCREL